MGTGDLCRVSSAAVCHGRARQISGTGPCGNCRRVLWLPNPRCQYSGKIFYNEKPGYKTMRVVMWLNVVLTPLIAYPEVKVQVRNLVQVVGMVAPFAPLGVGTGEIRFIEPQWVNCHNRPLPGAPRSGTPRESRDGMGIVERSCGHRARGVTMWLNVMPNFRCRT